MHRMPSRVRHTISKTPMRLHFWVVALNTTQYTWQQYFEYLKKHLLHLFQYLQRLVCFFTGEGIGLPKFLLSLWNTISLYKTPWIIHSGADTRCRDWARGTPITVTTNCTLWISQADTGAAAGNGIEGSGTRRLWSMEQSPPCAWEPVLYAKAYANHTYRNKDGLQFKLVKHLTLQGWGDRLMGEWHPFLQSWVLDFCFVSHLPWMPKPWTLPQAMLLKYQNAAKTIAVLQLWTTKSSAPKVSGKALGYVIE